MTSDGIPISESLSDSEEKPQQYLWNSEGFEAGADDADTDTEVELAEDAVAAIGDGGDDDDEIEVIGDHEIEELLRRPSQEEEMERASRPNDLTTHYPAEELPSEYAEVRETELRV